jgi:hypothetical protein
VLIDRWWWRRRRRRFRAWLETFLIGREQVLDGLREFVLVSLRAILFPGSLGVAIPDCG